MDDDDVDDTTMGLLLSLTLLYTLVTTTFINFHQLVYRVLLIAYYIFYPRLRLSHRCSFLLFNDFYYTKKLNQRTTSNHSNKTDRPTNPYYPTPLSFRFFFFLFAIHSLFFLFHPFFFSEILLLLPLLKS